MAPYLGKSWRPHWGANQLPIHFAANCGRDPCDRLGLARRQAWQIAISVGHFDSAHDVNFKGLISTALKGLPLRRSTSLDVVAMQTIIRSTRGNTARIFEMIGDLAVQAIKSGEERITTEMIAAWKPSIYERTLVA
jgi:hypothetical protein